MAVYLVAKLENGKRNTYICDVNNLSSTDSIPGEYLQIIYSSVDSLINMNTEISVYNAIYLDSEGTKRNSFICETSFDNVYESLRRNYGASDFISINKTDYRWYEIR